MNLLKVSESVYKIVNGQKTDRLFWGVTDNQGLVQLSLGTGMYQVEIDGIYNGLNYSTQPFNVYENISTSYEFKLAKTNLHLQNKYYQDLKNQPFTLYKYATDVNNNMIAGAEIGVFSTGYNGYADIYLPGGSYVPLKNSRYESDFSGFSSRIRNTMTFT